MGSTGFRDGKQEWLSDPRFESRQSRSENVLCIESHLKGWFKDKTMAEATKLLSDNGVPCSPVNTVAQAAEDPHLEEREIMVEVPDAIAGSIHVAGKMIKFGRTEMVVGSTPTIGQHSLEILSDTLSYSTEEIDRLKSNKVIRTSEVQDKQED